MKNRYILILALILFSLIAVPAAYFGFSIDSRKPEMAILTPDECQPTPAFVFEEICPEPVPVSKILSRKSHSEQIYTIPEMVVNQELTDKIIATQEAREMDGGPFLTSFDPGVVSYNPLKARIIPTDYGYLIKTRYKTIMSTPIAQEGRLYFSGGFNSYEYFCLDGKTGKEIWSVRLSDDGPSTGCIEGDYLIVNTESCTIFALDKNTGEHIWSWFLGDLLISNPAILNGRVYTTYPSKPENRISSKLLPSHPFACLDASNGEILWQVWLDGEVMTEPVTEDESLFLTTFPGTVYRLNPENGEILAAVKLGASSMPLVFGEYLALTRKLGKGNKIGEGITVLQKSDLSYIKTFNKVAAPWLNIRVQKNTKYKKYARKQGANNGSMGPAPVKSGAIRAAFNMGQNDVSSLQTFRGSAMTAKGDKLYTTMGNTIYCVNVFTEEILWKQVIKGDLRVEGGHLGTQPLIVDGLVMVVTYRGEINFYDAKSGEIRRSLDLRMGVRTKPALAGNWVYVPTTSGKIAAVDLSRVPDGGAIGFNW